MKYQLTGKLQGYVSPDWRDPLADATVKLYRHGEDQDVDALVRAGPKHTFAILSDEAVRAKEPRLLATTQTNYRGEFSVDLTEKTFLGHRGWTGGYSGEALEVDVYLRSIPGMRPVIDRAPVQCTLATIRPDWEQTDAGVKAHWEHTLSKRYWEEILMAFDRWVVCGRVARYGTNDPLSGVTVHAFDADVVQDDMLGAGVTDAEGRFRIDYDGIAHRQTPSGWASYETGGPDLYFRITAADGSILLDEDRARGVEPDRENVANCFMTHFYVGGLTIKVPVVEMPGRQDMSPATG